MEVSPDEFIELTVDKHLTLKDLVENPDKIFEVVMWDRNWQEYEFWNCFKNGIYEPSLFFRSNKNYIIFNEPNILEKKNTSWDILFNYGEGIEHPIHVYREKTRGCFSDCAENCSGNHVVSFWDYKSFCTCGNHTEEKDIIWKDLPLNTRVGWRGPIMLWDDVVNSSYKIKVEERSPREILRQEYRYQWGDSVKNRNDEYIPISSVNIEKLKKFGIKFGYTENLN